VTGPRAITFSQAVAEISKAVGRQIRYTQISGAGFAEGNHLRTISITVATAMFIAALTAR
jgi:uncharacterized protein YbjT (DUF2867 family)